MSERSEQIREAAEQLNRFGDDRSDVAYGLLREYADLLDAAAGLVVLLKETCQTCGGTGEARDVSGPPGYDPFRDGWPACLVCGGRGWTIRPEATELVAHVLYKQFYDTLDGEPFSDEDGHITVSAENVLIVLVETAEDKR